MAFNIKAYYEDSKDYYGNVPLEEVARDVYERGFKDKHPDYNTWKQSAGIDSALEEDRRLRNPTFEDKLRAATDNVAPKEESGGIVKSFLQGGAEGITTELPSMVGGALQFAGSHLPFKGIENAGKSLKDWAEEKRQELYGPEIERTGLDRIVYEGTKMLAPSLIPGGIVGTAARGLKGVKALSEAGKIAEATKAAKSATNIAAGSVAGLFGLSQAQQTKDTAEQAGVDPGLAPYATGAIEAAGEFLGTKYLAKIFRLDEADVVKRGAKEFVKDLIKTIGVEVGTEIGQQSGEAAVEKYTGIRPEANPVMEAIDVIGPTAFMTILTGGLAGASNKLRSENPEEREASQYIEKLKAGAMFSMAINEGLKTGEYEGVPFTPQNAIGIIKEAQDRGIFDTADLDRFKDKYPQLRDGLNGLIADNITKKIDEAATKEPTKPLTNTMRNLSDVPDFEEPINPEVKKLQDRITKTEDFLNRNANRKGEKRYNDYVARLEADKSKLLELTGGDQNGTLQTETEIENVAPTAPAAGIAMLPPDPKSSNVFARMPEDQLVSQAEQGVKGAITEVERRKAGQAENIETVTKAPELMTPEEFDAAKAQRDKELGHGEEGDTHGFIGNNKRIIVSPNERSPLRDALEAKKPVNAALFDRYNKDANHPLSLPDGYTKEGDNYIFKGEEQTALPAPLSQTDAATVGVKGKAGESLKEPWQMTRRMK